MNYDVALVLGTGIKQNGTLPDSCISNVKTAVSLYKNKEVSKLVFAGKWAWNCKYNPPITESLAMKQLAISLGVVESDIFIEDESVTTVSNLCHVKSKILLPNGYKSVLLVCSNSVQKPRNLYNLEMVLGPEFTYDVMLTDFTYPSQIEAELSAKESQKITEAQKFYHGVTAGDHELILQFAKIDLDKKILSSKLKQ